MNSTVVFYRDQNDIPALQWLENLPERVYAKGIVSIKRLAELGHELRRPECDYLREGIYELRWRLGHVNYRILYFFHGREAIVLAHGMTKEDRVPNKDMSLAIQRKATYLGNPGSHAHFEELI